MRLYMCGDRAIQYNRTVSVTYQYGIRPKFTSAAQDLSPGSPDREPDTLVPAVALLGQVVYVNTCQQPINTTLVAFNAKRRKYSVLNITKSTISYIICHTRTLSHMHTCARICARSTYTNTRASQARGHTTSVAQGLRGMRVKLHVNHMLH